MPFQIRTDRRPAAGGLDGTIYLLEEAGGSSRAEIWPALGFNCYRWQVVKNDQPLDLLYADPQLFDNGKPTRSGIPILFPFPNRIRNGHFIWKGKDYQLPLNDSSGPNAIHGFACRRPWRVVGQGGTDGEAWLSAAFQGSKDAPESLAYWPADYAIQVTYRLSRQRLRIEAQVENPDQRSLPFGLGYHPYFFVPVGQAHDCQAEVPARNYWELQKSLPTGRRLPVDTARDLKAPRQVDQLNLDDVLTDVANQEEPGTEGLCFRGMLKNSVRPFQLRVLCSPMFREMVVFTPPHRQAICLEPYTCTTDALNLQQQGIDAGVLELLPGARWSAVVEMVVS
jgi:aldose 1-epimerase